MSYLIQTLVSDAIAIAIFFAFRKCFYEEAQWLLELDEFELDDLILAFTLIGPVIISLFVPWLAVCMVICHTVIMCGHAIKIKNPLKKFKREKT